MYTVYKNQLTSTCDKCMVTKESLRNALLITQWTNKHNKNIDKRRDSVKLKAIQSRYYIGSFQVYTLFYTLGLGMTGKNNPYFIFLIFILTTLWYRHILSYENDLQKKSYIRIINFSSSKNKIFDTRKMQINAYWCWRWTKI